MKEDGSTTVRFTEKTQPLKNSLMPIYGLKNLVSAGVLLFSRLSDSEQKKIILEANGIIEQDEDAKAVQHDEAVAAQRSKARTRKKAMRSGA